MQLNKNTFFYRAAMLAASNLMLQLLGFIYRIVLSQLAGPEGMGVFTVVMQAYMIIMSVCVYGICVAVTAITARLYNQNDLAGTKWLVRISLASFLTLFIALALPVFFWNREIAESILGDARTAAALRMLLLCILLTGIENILKSVFYGIGKVRYNAISELGEQLFRIMFAFLLLSRFKTGDYGFTAFLIIFAMTLSEAYSVTVLTSLYVKNFRSKRHIKTARRSRFKAAGNFFAMALPSTATSISTTLFGSATTVLFPARLMVAGFEKSEALSALGIISGMAGPLFMLPLAFVHSLSTVLMPSISTSAGSNNIEALQRRINRGLQATGLMALPMTAVLLPFMPALCRLMFGQNISMTLAVFLAVRTVVINYLIVSISILNGMGLQRTVLLYSIIGDSLQLLLMYILTAVPEINVFGFIFSSIIGDGLRIMLNIGKIRHAAKVKIKARTAAVLPLLTSGLLWLYSNGCYGWLLDVTGNQVISMIISIFACILVYFTVLHFLGLRVLSYLRSILITTDTDVRARMRAHGHI